MSDSQRTGTEQLLLSNAVDRSINNMNLAALAGREVYFDPQYLKGIVDENYIVSSLRQALLANGCYLKERRQDATYVVEARAGAVGTNRHELLIGVPAFNLPNYGVPSGIPTAMPEIPFAKSTEQKGVAKISMFAFNRVSGEPVWQSGAFPIMSASKDTWVLGTGPFQKGTIYEGTRFAGGRLTSPFGEDQTVENMPQPKIPVTAEAVFPERPRTASAPPRPEKQAAREEPAKKISRRASNPPEAQVLRLPPTDRPHEGPSPSILGRGTAMHAVFDRSEDDGKHAAPGPLGGLFRPFQWFGEGDAAHISEHDNEREE